MPNRGEEIVKQYMNRNRWFVPAPSIVGLAEQIIVRGNYADERAVIDRVLLEQVRTALVARMNGGEIKTCKRAGSIGYRKASGREVETFKRRGLPSYKSRPKRTHAPSRERLATTLVT